MAKKAGKAAAAAGVMAGKKTSRAQRRGLPGRLKVAIFLGTHGAEGLAQSF